MDPQAQEAYEIGVKVGQVLGNLFLGSIVGLIPLFLGLKREDRVVGTIGFAACIAGQFMATILGSGSMAIGFVVAILVGGRKG